MAEHIIIDISGAGATVEGTAKGSPATEAFRSARGWRWLPSLRCWGLPRNLRPETVDASVWAITRDLEALGVTVEVVGDDNRETEEERAARRHARDAELVEVHQERAAAARVEGDAHWESGRRIADMIPMGQPILVGHHSERRHRRDLDRIHRSGGRAVAAWDEADNRERRAHSAAQRVAAAQARAAGPQFGPDDVAKGDQVRTRHGWHDVVRVNRKSVTVPSLVGGSWTDTIPWVKVLEARTPPA